MRQALPIPPWCENAGDFITRWLRDVQAHKVHAATRDRYTRDVRLHIKPGLAR